MSVMREAGEMCFCTLPYHFRSQVRHLDYAVPFSEVQSVFYTLPFHFRSSVRLLDFTVPFQKSSLLHITVPFQKSKSVFYILPFHFRILVPGFRQSFVIDV